MAPLSNDLELWVRARRIKHMIATMDNLFQDRLSGRSDNTDLCEQVWSLVEISRDLADDLCRYLGSRLNHTQYATMVAMASVDV